MTPWRRSEAGEAPGNGVKGLSATPEPSALNGASFGLSVNRSSSGRLVSAKSVIAGRPRMRSIAPTTDVRLYDVCEM